MDKISKALKKLSAKERAGNFETLHVKKLRGRKDIFRVRKGKIRLMYRVEKSGSIFILAIERRSERTYKF